jgi:hypothetical protein
MCRATQGASSRAAFAVKTLGRDVYQVHVEHCVRGHKRRMNNVLADALHGW